MGRSRFPARRCLRHFVRGYYLLTADAVFCPYRGIFTSIYQASVWHPYEIRVWCSRMGFAYGIRVWGCAPIGADGTECRILVAPHEDRVSGRCVGYRRGK
ncbi:MAG: hypothetical protein SOW44_05425 [Porphyromonas sp.]|nr:hypothetical protein [Porphyromonas sp.]